MASSFTLQATIKLSYFVKGFEGIIFDGEDPVNIII